MSKRFPWRAGGRADDVCDAGGFDGGAGMNAPERIWACMDGPMVGLFVSGGINMGWPEYVRADLFAALEAEKAKAERERDELREMALPFVAVHGERWSRERGLPDWHMAAHFYDMVKDLGGRVDGFIRVEMNADPVAEATRALTPEASHD